MKSLLMTISCLLFLAGCTNEQVAPTEELKSSEIPLQSCNLESFFINKSTFINTIGVVKQKTTNNYTQFYILIDGKEYIPCNLPTSLEKTGQGIRLNAYLKLSTHPTASYAGNIIELTAIKTVN
jgi:hypothetical protein